MESNNRSHFYCFQIFSFASNWSGRGFGYPDERVIGMVSDSNRRLIVAYWRQYFFIEYRNLPPETIGVPPLARAIVPSGTARKASGDLRRLRPAGQTSAGLLVILDFRRPFSRGRPLCFKHGGRGERRMEGIKPSTGLSPVPLESGLRKS